MPGPCRAKLSKTWGPIKECIECLESWCTDAFGADPYNSPEPN